MDKQWKLLRENIRREIQNATPPIDADGLTGVILDHVAGYKDRELSSLHKAVKSLTERLEQLERAYQRGGDDES